MMMRLTFVAIGLLGLSGCCSGAYFDDALGVLQVTFPVSHRPSASQNPSASQKAKEDI